MRYFILGVFYVLIFGLMIFAAYLVDTGAR